MTDLQHKQFEFAAIPFGLFSDIDVEQHSKAAPQVEDQDATLYREDVRAFGYDTRTPAEWTWVLFTHHDSYAAGDAAMSALEAAWKDGELRKPGVVVPLRYCRQRLVDGEVVNDTRVVFGRPRRFERDEENGEEEFGLFRAEMDFQLADNLSYSDTVDSISIIAPNGLGGGFTVPFTAPLNTITPPEPIMNTIQATGGDAPSPFEVELVGPITNPRIRSDRWEIRWRGHIPAEETVTISTYPWGLRAYTQDGANVSGGLVAGTRLSQIRISPGGETLHYDGQDTTGSSVCYVRWRAAHKTS